MRTIKFRGKNLHNGKWVCGYLSDVDNTPIGKVGIINSKPFSGCEESTMVIAESIGQFTGLHDKNGQEIYEGDILTWRSIICEEDPVMTWELPVTFYNGCFCLNDDFDMTLISVIYDSEEFGGVKIIGNIHDNPELMKGGEK